MYRITSNGPDGMSRTMTSYPDEAARRAAELIEQGRDEVWIADDHGRLFNLKDFESFVAANP